MIFTCGPLTSADLGIGNVDVDCRERKSLQKGILCKYRNTKLHIAAVTWERGHSHSLDQIKKDQNNLIRLAQIRNMNCNYQMDSWHSCQQGLEVRQKRVRKALMVACV